MDEKQREFLIEQIDKFKVSRPYYEALAFIMKISLKRLAKTLNLSYIIQSRAKEIISFSEKIQRPGKNFMLPIEKVNDLCGSRCILLTVGDVDKFCSLIEKTFNVHYDYSMDKKELLDVGEFGYLSRHYTVQLKRGTLESIDYPKIIDGLKINEEVLYGAISEIQVRTILQHAWSDIYHDLGYKAKVKVPNSINRQFYRIAATLEGIDNEFTNVIANLKVYESNYGAYLSKEEVEEMIERLDFVIEQAPGNSDTFNISLRIAKLARYIEKWDLIIHHLEKYTMYDNSVVFRELGIAMCKHYAKQMDTPEFRKGQEYLLKAVELDPTDSDALASLGGTWRKQGNLDNALKYYKQSYEANPEDPYAVGNYFLLEILKNKNFELFKFSRPVLKNVILKCEEQISLGVNIPWAYFDCGLFNLFIGNEYECIYNYILGIRFCTQDWMIQTTLGTLNLLKEVEDELPFFKIIQDVLHLGLYIRFGDKEALKNLKGRELDTEMKSPLLIMAGSTAAYMEKQIAIEFQKNMIDAFHDFKGTIISGGTVSGISGLAGNIQKALGESVVTIGYVPSEAPSDLELSPHYTRIQKTSGIDFSVKEPIQYWIDICVNGINLKNLKLLGIGGGKISALEYNLALLFGVEVGILENSIGAGSRLLQDPVWEEKVGETVPLKLTEIKNDFETIKEFIRF